uniref:Cell division cycle and apoptosis regulator protein 1 n=1 Tax=Lygus hesperus TaxID=30085 RepID=A0A0A9XIZ5_LYGHE
MSQYGQTTKNPPWVRSGQNMSQNTGNVTQSLMANALPMANAAQMLQYPQVFQGQLGQQMYGVGAVQYPTRALNSAAFQTNSNLPNSGGNQQTGLNNQGGNSGNANTSNPPSKSQRVFTGTVTKIQDKFGFVNDDIFFQTSCCMKGSTPVVGDRVLVEAVYNANMPFKWNATRIQVLSNNNRVDQGGRFNNSGNMYNAVPPPNENSGGGNRFNSGGSGGGGSRFSNNDRPMGNNRNNDRNRNRNPRGSGPNKDNVDDRKRKRDEDRSLDRERDRDRQRSPPAKKKSKSPVRRSRQAPRRPPPRYTIVVPKGRLSSPEADLMHLTKRYPNLYVPSDFFLSKTKWVESFPIRSPLSLNFPCNFHVMHRDVDSPYPNDAILEPADMDYIYVAKVMLLSSPGLEEMLLKTGITYKDDREGSISDDESVSSSAGSVTHISRLVHFLVGTRGKEAMAIGGPWSPSLDGENPERDPGVLVKTAIRTCKALTGIDLSSCTQWFRFLEVHYHRAESNHHGKVVPARVETVVLFVPDVWSASPSRGDWETITADYKKALEKRLNPTPSAPEPSTEATEKSDEKDGDTSKDEEMAESAENSLDLPKKDPTHYSQLDPKSMKVSELRDELEARNLSPKGLKSQLVARLAKAIKTEADEEEANGNVKDDPNAALEETEKEEEKDKSKEKEKEQRAVSPTPSSTSRKDEKGDDKKKDEEKDKDKDKKKEELSERDKLHLEKRYRLPENPHIIVHPNRVHKSGKYDCTVTSLSSLLGYRIDDSKEHSFEVSLFAEAFNEMLMRDFGFTVYKSLVEAPEKPKEEKKDDDKDKDKKKEKDSKEKSKDDDKDDKEDKDKKEEETVDGDEDKSASGEDKKKEDKIQRVVDNNVLLAFSYFRHNKVRIHL